MKHLRETVGRTTKCHYLQKQLMASLLNQKLDIFPDSLRNIAAERVGGSNKIGMTALHELGLFSDIVADRHGTALDTLAPYLSKVCLQRIIQ